MITSPAFRGKRYAVLGLARSGLATVNALVASGAEVTAWDGREEARAALPTGVAIGNPEEIELSGFDALVVSPGVPLNSHPVALRAKEAGVPIIGDIELFAQARASLPPHKVVGITGTNGKSTTTALIHHMCEVAGLPTTLGGNIGLPILGQAPLPESGIYVLELSSYQIDLTQRLDCDVAVLLNITPDHLDRYDGFAAYAASKARIFEMQSPDHVAVIAIGDTPSYEVSRAAPANVRTIAPGGCLDQSRWPRLQGPHNAQNALAAIEAATALGVSQEAINTALVSFPGLPHRMESVRVRNGVEFINDSKATNAEAAAPALAAYPSIHWILGGLAKTADLDPCRPHFGHVKAAYTIGASGSAFAEILRGDMPVVECETLDRAVTLAADAAEEGETVLLSPACASFDQFADFEDRGRQFRAEVNALS